MVKHIVVGVDLSAGAEEALGYAVSLARHFDAKVTMVSITSLPPAGAVFPPGMMQAAEAYTHRSTELLAKFREDLEALRERAAGGSVSISSVVSSGFADRDLARIATELGADLVVVGTHGRGFWGRLMIGSVAEKTARTFEGDVLVARGSHHQADGGFRRILVASDLSERGQHALSRAIAVAAPGAAIELVHAWQDPLQSLSFDPAVSIAMGSAWREVEEQIYRELRAQIAKCQVNAAAIPTIESRVLVGIAAQTLTERAQALEADLIVVGAHSHRGVARFLLGSTAEAVLRHAACSVLVAKRPAA